MNQDKEMPSNADIEDLGKVVSRYVCELQARRAAGERFTAHQVYRGYAAVVGRWSARVVLRNLVKVELDRMILGSGEEPAARARG